MLEQPGCPNLYWALTNLPIPLVPIDKGTEGERVGILSEFRDLDDSAPMSAEQLKTFITHMVKLLEEPGKPMKLHEWLDTQAKQKGTVSAAIRRLVKHGLPEERLLRFPADQVLLLDEKREYEVRRDELMKLMNLPIWQVQLLATDVEKATKPPAIFAEILVAGVYAVRKSQARLDQRIALLRHIEALRLHAAQHDGALPATLSEIGVPLPDDPYTGKPFRYEYTGTTAHLRGSPPLAEQNNAAFNVHYEVTFQK